MRRISVPLYAPILVMVIVVALVNVGRVSLGSGGSSQTYSIDEVREAFAGQRIALSEAPTRQHLRPCTGGCFLPAQMVTDLPATRDELVPLTVVVASDSEADDAWPDYVAQQDAVSFDARRANVVVVSDGPAVVSVSGLDAKRRAELRAALAWQRDRIRAALASLPDRD